MRESTEKELFAVSIILSYVLTYVFVEVNPLIDNFNFTRLMVGIAIFFCFVILWNFSEVIRPEFLMNAVLLLSVAGIAVSGVMTYSHYNTTGGFCPVAGDGSIPCDIINKSQYAKVLGFPVAIIGILGYLFVFLFGLMLKNKLLYAQHMHQHLYMVKTYKPGLESMFVAIILLGLFFTLWLNYIQFFVLKTLCLECEISAVTIMMLFLLALKVWREK